jgi:FkbM family methyltransferase
MDFVSDWPKHQLPSVALYFSMKQLHVNSWVAYQEAMDKATHRTAIDVGANEGNYTETLVQNGFSVYAFEPVPQMYSKLKSKFYNNPKVRTFNLGISSITEMIKDATVLEAWSIGHIGDGGLQATPNKEVAGTFDMVCVPLDSIIPKDEGIGIIKVDVDGYESEVLWGAQDLIMKWRPAILCEFGCYLEKMGSSPQAFVNFITQVLDYNIVSMDGKNVFKSWAEVQPQWPNHTTFDVILLPR